MVLSSTSFTYANYCNTILYFPPVACPSFVINFSSFLLFSPLYWFITISLYLFLPMCLFIHFSLPSILFSLSIFLPFNLFIFLSIYIIFLFIYQSLYVSFSLFNLIEYSSSSCTSVKYLIS